MLTKLHWDSLGVSMLTGHGTDHPLKAPNFEAANLRSGGGIHVIWWRDLAGVRTKGAEGEREETKAGT